MKRMGCLAVLNCISSITASELSDGVQVLRQMQQRLAMVPNMVRAVGNRPDLRRDETERASLRISQTHTKANAPSSLGTPSADDDAHHLPPTGTRQVVQVLHVAGATRFSTYVHPAVPPSTLVAPLPH